MTCFDMYITEHELPVKGCPHDFKYAEKPKDCYSISCFKDCWARKVSDEKVRESK